MNKNIDEHHEELEKKHHSSHKMGTITIALIFGLFGIWSVVANIATTITANGKVITNSYNKVVMHPRGGIVTKMYVKEGESIKKDQPLLKLESTEAQSKLNSYTKKHDVNLFTICRLRAESKLEKDIDCKVYEKRILLRDNVSKLKTDTEMLFRSDIKSLQAKIDLLESQKNILTVQNNGLKDQIRSNRNLLASYQRELKKWKKLLKSSSVDELKVIDTQRRIEQVNLQIGTLQSRVLENISTIKSHSQQIELEKETFKNTALTKLNDLELENGQIADSIIALKNTIYHATIKSPSDGLVTDMKIHTSGEVVSPQKQIMAIVPDNQDLIIEAYVSPSDIEKIYKGQKTEISFPAFVDPSALPIEGELTYVSADTIVPEGSKENFYVILVDITDKGAKAIKQNNFKIIPGMPSAVFIKTGEKTLMQYLLQPIIQMFKGIYHAN